MRVIFLQDHLRSGGTERQTLHIADGLAQAGYEVHLIVFRRGGVLDDKAANSAFALHFLKQGPLKTNWFAPGLKSKLQSLQPDIVFAMGRMANCHAGLLCRAPHSYRIISTFRTGRPIPSLYRKALRESNHLVANSQEALDRISKIYGITRSDSSVIYNGCLRDFTTSIPSLRNESPEKRRIQLASVSMFRPQKKQIRLLRICAGLPESIDWRLILAGDGVTRNACIRETDTLGISNRVEFPGLLRDPSPLYFESDIAVHTSEQESLPNFLVEAQMAGLPVIAYDAGGVAETFVHEKSGYLVAQGDEAAFRKQLQFLIETPNLRLQMSEAARDYAARHFTPKAQLKAYQALLKKLRT